MIIPKSRFLFLISNVLDSVKIFKSNSTDKFKRIYPSSNETSVVLSLDGNKKRKLELNNSSGYLSQSSRSVVINSAIKAAAFYDSKGYKTRVVNF